MATAAIFDLDRTLIAGSSAEVFGAKLADVGVSTAVNHPSGFRVGNGKVGTSIIARVKLFHRHINGLTGRAAF